MAIYRIYPTAHYCTAVFGVNRGWHTAAAVWGEDEADCSGSVDDRSGALNESDYGTIRSNNSYYNNGRVEYVFDAPPSQIVITNVSIVAYLRTSSGNNYGINEPPRLKGFVNPGGTRYYQTSPAGYFIVNRPINRNSAGPTGTFEKFTAGSWNTNPATGSAWSLADLAAGTFKAGIETGGVAEGQAGNGLPPTSSGYQASLDVALICIEVTGSPSQLVVEPVRQLMSILLWLRRNRLRLVEQTVTLPHTDVALGESIHLDDPDFPTGDALGTSRRDWSAHPLFVVSKSERLGANEARIQAWDQRELAASAWSPLHTDLGADDNWSGIPFLDRGGGRAVTRAQSGWVHRPNDFRIRDAASGYWRITPWGLSICGGSYSGSTENTGELTRHSLNNGLSQGSGTDGTALANGNTTAFTDWVVGVYNAGQCVLKVDTSFLFDVNGYRRAARLTQGAADADQAMLTATVAGFSSTQRVRLHIVFRPVVEGEGMPHFMLCRGDKYWNATTGAWDSGVVSPCVTAGVAIGAASLEKVGDCYEYWSHDIVVGVNGSLQLWVYSPLLDLSSSVDVFVAEIVSSGAATGAGAPVIRRDFLMTTTVALDQAGDVIDLDNQSDYRIWDASRGTWSLQFTPLWDHEDLTDGAVKVIVCANHQATANDREYLCYTRVNSTTGAWQYVRTVGGVTTTASFATSSAAGTLARRWTPVKLTMRWTSTSEEFGLAAYTQSLFVDGVKATDAVAGGQSSQLTSGCYVALGRLTSGAAGTADAPHYFADGMIANLEGRLFCLSDDEITRLHARMQIANALPESAV